MALKFARDEVPQKDLNAKFVPRMVVRTAKQPEIRWQKAKISFQFDEF